MRTGLLAVLLTCLAALLCSATASAAGYVFWTNDGDNSLGAAALDGGVGLAIGPGTSSGQPYGTAIDAATGRIYFADGLNNAIMVANFPGIEAEQLVTTGAEVNEPEGLAIDPEAGRVYWANAASDTISWAAIDGSGGGEIDTAGAPIEEPSGVVVDPAQGRIYWASYEDSLIGWASLDGLGAGELEVFDVNDLEGPTGLAIDGSTGRLYWANYDSGTIGWSTLDGSEGGLQNVGPLAVPEGAVGIAIDPEAEKLYWANEKGFIGSLNLVDGTVAELDINGASPWEPSFPVLLEEPKFEPGARPASIAVAPLGSTLSCASTPTEPDLVEAFLYRAPQTVAYEWTHEGAAVAGTTGQTLVASEPGSYSCAEVATNAIGSTSEPGGDFSIEGPPVVVTPPPAPPPVSPPTPPPAEPPTPQPNHVTLPTVTVVKVKSQPGRGTATVLAKISGPGIVALSGIKVVHGSVKAAGAGVAKLKVVAKSGTAMQLLRDGNARVRVRITFVTSEGGIASTTRVLVLRLVTK